MWIVTEHGFFSFVVDRKDNTVVHLRARLREDLERNFPDAEVYEKPGADYLFRARVTKVEVAARMTEMILEADITGHFKDEVNRRAAKGKHGSRSSAMYAFWNGMAAMQPYAPYSKIPRPEPKKYVAPPKLSRPGDHGLPPHPRGLQTSVSGSGYARDFDWDRSFPSDDPWDDTVEIEPVTGVVSPSVINQMSDEEWSRLSVEELDAILDEEERQARQIDAGEIPAPSGALDNLEVMFRDQEGAYPAPVVRGWAQVEADRREADRRRQTSSRKGRRGGRKNRHNQRG